MVNKRMFKELIDKSWLKKKFEVLKVNNFLKVGGVVFI